MIISRQMNAQPERRALENYCNNTSDFHMQRQITGLHHTHTHRGKKKKERNAEEERVFGLQFKLKNEPDMKTIKITNSDGQNL